MFVKTNLQNSVIHNFFKMIKCFTGRQAKEKAFNIRFACDCHLLFCIFVLYVKYERFKEKI